MLYSSPMDKLDTEDEFCEMLLKEVAKTRWTQNHYANCLKLQMASYYRRNPHQTQRE
jgi:hypothetical protein